ncbi:mucin-3B-like [Hyla sarda]|uniref:mucin-3B-like n=1 Tax=Hyla sarda TaxID=327740 RepID=UPI0024C3899F|nr:mucin-3B-like [Hyla sarda]
MMGFALQAAVLGISKSEPKNGQLSIQRSGHRNVTFFRKDIIQMQKHPERQAIMILEERKVNYNEIKRKSMKKRSVELYAEFGSGDIFSTLSPESTSSPEGSGDGFTTPEGSGDAPTSSVDPKPTITIAPLQCRNGGFFNGKICECGKIYFGDRCEFISGRIEIGPSINVTVNVELRFVNRIFNENLEDISSRGYEEFETIFKKEMALLYRNVSGYKDVEILNIRNGSVIVNHTIIVEVEYMSAVALDETYNTVFHDVETQLENLKTENCTSGTSPLCINGTSYSIKRVPVPSMEELCSKIIPDSLKDFYTANRTHTGVTCLSDCDADSPNHHDCNDGVCLILPNTGARCSCPDTDQFIYASGDCKGKMSKSALFGGVGAAIGVLVISFLIVGFFQLKKWRRQKRQVSKDEFQPNTDDIWVEDEIFTNFTANMNAQQDRDSSSSGSMVENFRPVLDKINTSVEITTKRPSISMV